MSALRKSRAVGQDFERAGTGEAFALLHHLSDNGEYEVLFAETVGVFNAMFFCHSKSWNVEGLEF